MQKIAFIVAASLMAGTMSAADNLSLRGLTANDDQKKDTTEYVFTDIKVLPHTSVKNQSKSGTCWCFSTTSFLEDEILRKGGDSLDLSEMFTVRQCYLEKADRYVRMYGSAHFAAGGATLDVLHVLGNQGAVPEEIYKGINYGEENHDHAELDAALKSYLDVVMKKPRGKLSPVWRQGVESILDTYLGKVPETFTYNGKTYTPKSYAATLPINVDDYVPVTSFTHHPFYEAFAIEVPDNWLWEKSMNVPMEEMKAIVDNAIENGYPVAWAADVSEPGFRYSDGYAVMPEKKKEDLKGTEQSRWEKISDKKDDKEKGPKKEITVTQELRQEMYDNQQTTDDHGMEIVGIAKDQNGNRYYKVRNSWGTKQKYGGLFYVSEPFFLAKTMQILVHKDAIPKNIAKKFKK